MKKRHTSEQIIEVLRRMEAALAAGKTVAEASQECGIGLATYYVWRRKYGGMEPDQLEHFLKLEGENKQLKKRIADLHVDNTIVRTVLSEQLVDPAQKRDAVQRVRQSLGVSERRACAALSLSRSSHRYKQLQRKDTEALVEAMRRVQAEHPRHGYRRIAALLRAEGWSVSDIQVYRLSRRHPDRSTQ
jgi:putative transposase